MQFLNPLVLYGLLALSIPVLIHLFNFRKTKRVFFTNVRFLRELQLASKRRSQLKHLLVLIMRLLAYAALILAFAMPVYQPDGGQEGRGKPLVVVYLDNSFSMQSQGNGGVLFETAMRKAMEIAGYYDPADEFYLITNDFSPRYSRVVNRSDFTELVTGIQLSSASRNISEIYERVSALWRDYPERRLIFFILSDFQRSTLQFTLSEPDRELETYLLPMQHANPGNLYIDSVWMDIPVIRPGQIVDFQVRVGNSGSVTAEEVPVALLLNGREAAVGTVTVPPSGTTQMRLTTRIAGEGIYHGEITIEDYPVVFDDRYHIGTIVSQRRNVLVINGEKPEPSLNRLFAADTLFYVESRSATQIDFSALNRNDIIYCNGLKALSSGLQAALKGYVEEGGILVIIPPDDQEDLSQVNSLLNALGVANYGKTDTAEVRVSSIDFDHSLYKGVYSEKPSNLAMPVVYRHYPIQLKSVAGEAVVMKLLNDHPLLLSSPAGKGLVYLFATSLRPSATNLALHAEIFVPPVYNMALFSGTVPPLSYTLGVDKSALVPKAETVGESTFRVRDIAGTLEFIPGHRNDPMGVLIFFEDQVSSAGNYLVWSGDSAIAPLAFNFSHQESDLRSDEEKNLREWIREGGFQKMRIFSSGGKSVTEKLREINDGVKVWRYFVMAALLFLLIEVMLLRFWRNAPMKRSEA